MYSRNALAWLGVCLLVDMHMRGSLPVIPVCFHSDPVPQAYSIEELPNRRIAGRDAFLLSGACILLAIDAPGHELYTILYEELEVLLTSCLLETANSLLSRAAPSLSPTDPVRQIHVIVWRPSLTPSSASIARTSSSRSGRYGCPGGSGQLF